MTYTLFNIILFVNDYLTIIIITHQFLMRQPGDDFATLYMSTHRVKSIHLGSKLNVCLNYQY